MEHVAKLEDFERRIDRLESRALISELCTEYGLACDLRDTNRLAGLFTSDVCIRSLNGAMNARGRDAAIAMYEEMFKVRGPSFHWTHDSVLTFDQANGDRAYGFVLSHAETTPHGTTTIAGLRYNDVYRRLQGRWFFEERVLSFSYSTRALDYVAKLPHDERVATATGWRAADAPEADVLWRSRHGLKAATV